MENGKQYKIKHIMILKQRKKKNTGIYIHRNILQQILESSLGIYKCQYMLDSYTPIHIRADIPKRVIDEPSKNKQNIWF